MKKEKQKSKKDIFTKRHALVLKDLLLMTIKKQLIK